MRDLLPVPADIADQPPMREFEAKTSHPCLSLSLYSLTRLSSSLLPCRITAPFAGTVWCGTGGARASPLKESRALFAEQTPIVFAHRKARWPEAWIFAVAWSVWPFLLTTPWFDSIRGSTSRRRSLSSALRSRPRPTFTSPSRTSSTAIGYHPC